MQICPNRSLASFFAFVSFRTPKHPEAIPLESRQKGKEGVKKRRKEKKGRLFASSEGTQWRRKHIIHTEMSRSSPFVVRLPFGRI